MVMLGSNAQEDFAGCENASEWQSLLFPSREKLLPDMNSDEFSHRQTAVGCIDVKVHGGFAASWTGLRATCAAPPALIDSRHLLP